MAFNFCVSDSEMGLLTDLYELTMMQAYFDEGMHEEAVFDLFVRRMPANRNFLLACGLDDALSFLEQVRFSTDAIEYLSSLGLFSDAFLAWLADFRFEGDVYAMREGTPVFPNEPLLQIVAPIAQAQFVETFLLNQVQLQTMMASKAIRVVTAAGGRAVVDFGMRRMHGADATLKAARAFYVAGVTSTSNVLAGKRYGIPVSGTMAHSYVEAHDNEPAAFHAFIRSHPDTVLLVDTYDTIAGVENVVKLAQALPGELKVRGIRLDSGDLKRLAHRARGILDDHGLHDVRIIASSSLDEFVIASLIRDEAPIDGFGVGTSMGVSSDAPSLDIVYKIASYAGRGIMKLAPDKATLPGRKQVYRYQKEGHFTEDVICLAEEAVGGQPLLERVMQGGRKLPAAERPLEEIRQYAAGQISRLPESLLSIEPAAESYRVSLSETLTDERERIRKRILKQVSEREIQNEAHRSPS